MPPEHCLYLLGAPRIAYRGKPIAVDTRKALALLAYLILGEAGSGGEYTRDHLAALLYPDADQSSARGALRRTLSALRAALGEEVLLTHRDRVSIRMGALWVDVLAFREKFEQCARHPHAPAAVCRACLPLLQEAVALGQGEFMAGFSLRDSRAFEEWQFFQAEALQRNLSEALDKLSWGLVALGEDEMAAHQTRRWLALDPLREEAHRRLMLIYAWGDQRSAALRQYRECMRILNRELGVLPLEETVQLYQAILENRIPPRPSLASASEALPSPAPSDLTLSVLPNREESHGGDVPFVGRTLERQILGTAHQKAASEGFVIALEGEAGIGKTRLALEFLNQVRRMDARIIQTRCYEGEAVLSYAPILEALTAALATEEGFSALRNLAVERISPAAQLLPGLHHLFTDLPPAPAPNAPGAQARFFDALRLILEALLHNSSSGTPGVLFIDDVQWMDAASLDLLTYLARRLKGGLLLLSWRSDGVPKEHPLRLLLAQIEREHRAVILHLDRLRLHELEELLRATPGFQAVSPAQVQRLYQETEGNPFFIVEYLENLLQKPVKGESFSQPGENLWSMPASVRNLLQARLLEVGELGTQLLSAAAVLGRSFDFSILREISGRSEIETITGLEILLKLGLIVERSNASEPVTQPLVSPNDAPRYDFSHDKLRELVYDQTSQARRRLLHQRAGEAFAARARNRPERVSLAAYHFQHAGQYAQAATAYFQAGELARRVYAYHEAIAHFQNALVCGYPELATLNEVIGDLHAALGEYQLARASYETAAAQCSSDHLPWIEHKLGNVSHQLGEWELAECFFRTALDELSDSSRLEASSLDERAQLLTDWSRTAYRRGDLAQAHHLAAQALQLAEQSHDRSALAQAHNILGILERASGNPARALDHLQRSLEIAEKLEDPGPRAAALNNLARLYAQNGELSQAVALTERALALCIQRNDRHRLAALHNNLADLFHLAGETEQSMEHLRQAVMIFAEIGDQATHPGSRSEAEKSPLDPVDGLYPEIWKLSEW